MSPADLDSMYPPQHCDGEPPALRAAGRLRPLPFGAQPVEAGLGVVPLAGAREFAVMDGFAPACATPVLLAPRQRYAILAEIVTSVLEGIPGVGVVALHLGPGEFRLALPAVLLDERVALVHDPLALMLRLHAEGAGNVVCVWQALRTDGFETADNSIAVALFAPTAPAAAAFAELAAGPLLARFTDIRLDRHE